MPISFVFLLIFFNVTTNNASRVLVTLYALKLGAAPLTVGLLAATFAVFPLLFSWHAGKVTDRFGARWPILFGVLVGACCLLLPYFVSTLPVLFVAAALSGLAAMFYTLANQNLIGTLSTADKRARNYGYASIAISAGNGLGPLMAGLSIDGFGHESTFLGIAAMFAVPAIMLAVWGHRLPGGERDSAPGHGIRHTLTNPLLWPVLAASSLTQVSLDLFQVYVPVYGNTHGLSASAIGGVLAMAAVGGFASRIILPRLIAWASEEKLLTYALIIGAFGFAAVPFFQSAGALAMVALVFGFGLSFSHPITLTILYSRSLPGRAGQTLGLRLMLENGARLMGPTIFGTAVSLLGLPPAFLLNALVLGLGGLITRIDTSKTDSGEV